jgi:putative transposase
MEKLPRKDSQEIRTMIKRVFEAVTMEDVRRSKDELISRFESEPKYEKALATLEEGFEDAIQYLNFPEKLHCHIRSTNSLERLNQEVRRWEKVLRIFPNTQSAFRLVGAVLMQYKEVYSTRKTLLNN